MKRERGILQHGVQPIAVERRGRQPRERVRRDDDEEEESDADRGLDGKYVGLELPGKIIAEGRDRRAE